MLLRFLAVVIGITLTTTNAWSDEPVASQVQNPIQIERPGAGQKIRDALTDDKTTLAFVEIPLTDVVAYVKDRHHFEIVFDTNVLSHASIDPTKLPVSINIHDLSLQSAFNLILGEKELGYVIQNDVLLITTKEKAKSTLVGRIYDVHDLVPNGADASKAMSELADFIPNVPSWNSSGSIKSFNRMGISVLLISQNAEAHEEIEYTLSVLHALVPQKTQ